MGDSAGIQERCMQDGDENLKPHLCTVNYTVAEQGLAQYSRTSASPKRQFGCAHLVLERLITRTWPGCASWLPDLGMKFPAKKGAKKPGLRLISIMEQLHPLIRVYLPTTPCPTQIAQLWGSGVLWGFLRSGDKGSVPKTSI